MDNSLIPTSFSNLLIANYSGNKVYVFGSATTAGAFVAINQYLTISSIRALSAANPALTYWFSNQTGALSYMLNGVGFICSTVQSFSVKVARNTASDLTYDYTLYVKSPALGIIIEKSSYGLSIRSYINFVAAFFSIFATATSPNLIRTRTSFTIS